MSSARKRAAIQKAHNEVDRLRQRLMLAENHIAILRTMAEAIGRGGDVMCEALKKIASPTQTTDLLWWQIVAREALAKVGADGTADKGSNVEVTGAARLYRAASVWTAGLDHEMQRGQLRIAALLPPLVCSTRAMFTYRLFIVHFYQLHE